MLALNSLMTRPMARAISGLVRAGELEAWSAERLLAIDVAVERYPPGAVIAAPNPGVLGLDILSLDAAAPGARCAPNMKWLLDGWICEARVLSDGQRQIFSFGVPGDVVELPSTPHSRVVVALTAVTCVDAAELLARSADPDEMLEAMSRSTGLAVARRYEQLARLGRRSALVRLASQLVELHDRLATVGMVRGEEFALPLRHEELADALGLSPVHVTRCLKTLRQRGLMVMKFRRVSGFKRAEMEQLCF
jgi:CRP-like cAMP-binding protein